MNVTKTAAAFMPESLLKAGVKRVNGTVGQPPREPIGVAAENGNGS
jgi:hypothetical protein